MDQDKGGLRAVETVVTPAMAAAWLAGVTGNRKLQRDQVDYLVREISSGNWRLTHQGIAFDKEGLLVDGQHRLTAIVEAGKPCRLLVTRGIEREDALRAVDQGKIRTRGQLFAMNGEKNALQKASIVRGISLLTNPDLAINSALGPADDMRILERHRAAIEETLADSSKLSSKFLAVAALMIESDRAIGDQFRSGVVHGVNLAAGDPRLALREFLMLRASRKALNGEDIIVKSACAAQAFMAGDPLVKLQVSAARFREFCETIRIPVNRSLYVYAGGERDRLR